MPSRLITKAHICRVFAEMMGIQASELRGENLPCWWVDLRYSGARNVYFSQAS